MKGFLAGVALFLVFVIPAYGGPSPLTTNYPGAAFLVPIAGTSTAGVYRPTVPYMVGATPWVNVLNPITPIYQATGGGTTLPGAPMSDFNLLSTLFPGPGWSYASGVLAPNSLTVKTYAAIGPPQVAGAVGADFYVQYTARPAYTPPGGGATITDPTTNLHWIQVVYDNYNISGYNGANTSAPEGYGKPEFIVDNGASPRGIFTPYGRDPYYDDGGAATSSYFFDRPLRDNPGQKDTWVADLYLVTGPVIGAGPGLITIYGGVQWGWNNYPAPVPLPSALLLFAPALAGIGVVRRRFSM